MPTCCWSRPRAWAPCGCWSRVAQSRYQIGLHQKNGFGSAMVADTLAQTDWKRPPHWRGRPFTGANWARCEHCLNEATVVCAAAPRVTGLAKAVRLRLGPLLACQFPSNLLGGQQLAQPHALRRPHPLGGAEWLARAPEEYLAIAADLASLNSSTLFAWPSATKWSNRR